MTVGQLITELQKYDKDSFVIFGSDLKSRKDIDMVLYNRNLDIVILDEE